MAQDRTWSASADDLRAHKNKTTQTKAGKQDFLAADFNIPFHKFQLKKKKPSVLIRTEDLEKLSLRSTAMLLME